MKCQMNKMKEVFNLVWIADKCIILINFIENLIMVYIFTRLFVEFLNGSYYESYLAGQIEKENLSELIGSLTYVCIASIMILGLFKSFVSEHLLFNWISYTINHISDLPLAVLFFLFFIELVQKNDYRIILILLALTTFKYLLIKFLKYKLKEIEGVKTDAV